MPEDKFGLIFTLEAGKIESPDCSKNASGMPKITAGHTCFMSSNLNLSKLTYENLRRN